ncbi:MAG: hypothetical protein QOJ89_521, partial [bacterium]
RRDVVAAVGASHLLHLAWYADHGSFWEAPENADWSRATHALLDEFAGMGGCRAVLAGSCAEYDWGAPQPLREDAPLVPATYYGRCKHATRELAEELGRARGVDVAWGRIFFLYGPGEDGRRLVASVARALVGGERAATTAGTQLRDFLHVDDVAGAFAALVAGDVRGAVNVASGTGVAVRRIVETLAAAAGREDLLDIGALPERAGDPPAIVADVGRLRDEVGFVPAVDLARGLEQTVAWWRERRRATERPRDRA